MTPTPDAPILEIRHLQKSYGDHAVLRDLSFSVRKGEAIAILGPSGCGKSTLLRCVNGLETIDGGELVWRGQPLHQTRPADWRQLRQQIGMVFQNYELFPNLTVMQNLLLAPVQVQKRPVAEVREEAEALLARVALADKADAWPRTLSGGQKQRIAIVRALAMKPQAMLFDEVTASLDPEMVREVLEVMQDLAEGGMTMLMVTHELHFARRAADRIVFLDQGKVLEDRPPDAFFTAPESDRVKQFLNVFDY
jgi:polar amino acid transport system ATP-binding protein